MRFQFQYISIVVLITSCQNSDVVLTCNDRIEYWELRGIKECLSDYWVIIHSKENATKINYINSSLNLTNHEELIFVKEGHLIAHSKFKWVLQSNGYHLIFHSWDGTQYSWHIDGFENDTLNITQDNIVYGLIRRKFTPSVNCVGTLVDKPPDTIKNCITGNWKWHYMYGGFEGKRHDLLNSYVFFKMPDSLWIVYEGELQVKESIEWIQVSNQEARPNFVISFNWQNLPFDWKWSVLTMKGDTLIISDYGISDGYTYFLTRIE